MRKITFACVWIVILSGVLIAQDGTGGTAGAPFRMGFDARSIGNGNAVTASAPGDHPSVYNPALLPYVNRQNIHVGAALLPLDRSLFHLSFSTPLPPSAGLGFSVTGARVGDIQGRDINGIPTDVYSTNEYAIALSFGLQPARDLSIGVTARLLHARLIPELSSTTVGLDFGASYLINTWLRFGLSVRDVNSKYRWDSTPLYGREGNNTVDQFPRRLIFAVAAEGPVTFSTEAELVSDLLLFRIGISSQIHPNVTVRAGLDGIDPERRIGTRFMTGASIEDIGTSWSPSIDYAFMVEPFAPVGGHILTLRFHPGE